MNKQQKNILLQTAQYGMIKYKQCKVTEKLLNAYCDYIQEVLKLTFNVESLYFVDYFTFRDSIRNLSVTDQFESLIKKLVEMANEDD